MSMRPGPAIEREKRAFAAHRAALGGSALPPPHEAAKGTFVHGFMLPFSLIAATLRDRELRGPYLRLLAMRGLLVVLVGIAAVAGGNVSAREGKPGPGASIIVHKSKKEGAKSTPVHVDIPGFHVDIGDEDKPSVSVLGKQMPVQTVDDDEEPGKAAGPQLNVLDVPEAAAAAGSPAPPPAPPTFARRMWTRVTQSWKWLLALLTVLSATEGVVVFFSRRWDDWLSFHTSRLAAIRPEDEVAKTPKVALDLRWLYRKMKRRIRGYVVFAAGLPALLPLRLVPTAGTWLFTIAATLWGWYWLGVFTAAKSAHAWADEERALSPAPIRALNERISPSFVFGPIRWYGRAWARITRSVNPAATTFERSPAAFLGLALARVILALPGLYLLARPVVPVAAGRLCAEVDPLDRFSVPRVPA
ncbi:MAG: uncharacterized protein JWP87_1824 [Labilithrix sp.]|nr:uncharacterized protein [Labilithrix sp.]